VSANLANPTEPTGPAKVKQTPTLTAAGAILAKDLRSEARTLRSLAGMGLFAVSTFVIFRFGLDRTQLSGDLASGTLWLTLLFAAILGLNRLFVAEREEGGFDAIRMAPIDRNAMWLAKIAAFVIYMCAVEIVVVPIFALFFLTEFAGLLPLAGIMLLANIGLAATGTLISSMATNTRARDLLIPLILLPLIIPLMIATTAISGGLLDSGGPDYERFGDWLMILGLYDLIFLLLGYAIFEFMLED
jgi:heme exporter protein B